MKPTIDLWIDSLREINALRSTRLSPSKVDRELDQLAKALGHVSSKAHIHLHKTLRKLYPQSDGEELVRVISALNHPRHLTQSKHPTNDLLKAYVRALINDGMKPTHYEASELVQTIAFICEQSGVKHNPRRVVRDVLDETKEA